MRLRGRAVVVISILSLTACAALIDLQEPSGEVGDDGGLSDGTLHDGAITNDGDVASDAAADAAFNSVFGDAGVVELPAPARTITPYGSDGAIAYLGVDSTIHVLLASGIEARAGTLAAPATTVDGFPVSTVQTIAQVQGKGPPFVVAAGLAAKEGQMEEWIASLEQINNTSVSFPTDDVTPITLDGIASMPAGSDVTLSALYAYIVGGSRTLFLATVPAAPAATVESPALTSEAFATSGTFYGVLSRNSARIRFSLFDNTVKRVPGVYDGGVYELQVANMPDSVAITAAPDASFLGFFADTKGLKAIPFRSSGTTTPLLTPVVEATGLHITSVLADASYLYVAGCAGGQAWLARLQATNQTIDTSFNGMGADAGILTTPDSNEACIDVIVADAQHHIYLLINDRDGDNNIAKSTIVQLHD